MNTETSSHPFDLLLEIDRRSRSEVDSSEVEQPTGTVGRLALRLGPWNLMFNMEDVAEIIPVPHVSRVPGVKSWLMGIANLRGTVISIVDLKEFLGGKPSNLMTSSRVVVVRSGEWDYGLLVDEIIGMRHFGPDNRQPSKNMVDVNLRSYVTEVFSSEDKLWLAFNVSQLLTDDRFLGAAS